LTPPVGTEITEVSGELLNMDMRLIVHYFLFFRFSKYAIIPATINNPPIINIIITRSCGVALKKSNPIIRSPFYSSIILYSWLQFFCDKADKILRGEAFTCTGNSLPECLYMWIRVSHTLINRVLNLRADISDRHAVSFSEYLKCFFRFFSIQFFTSLQYRLPVSIFCETRYACNYFSIFYHIFFIGSTRMNLSVPE
jgi:hypothetical protein